MIVYWALVADACTAKVNNARSYFSAGGMEVGDDDAAVAPKSKMVGGLEIRTGNVVAKFGSG